MASQNLNVSTANSGQGDKLRDAFIAVRKMFHDVYGISASYADALDISGETFHVSTTQIEDNAVTQDKIANNAVDHDQLSESYTGLSDLGTGSSFALNFDSAATFEATMNADSTFTISNAQQGQVIDLIVDGNFTVTFAETGSTFNKVGSTSYDGSTDNIIQIMCTNDTDGAKVYHFAVGTYISSTTA